MNDGNFCRIGLKLTQNVVKLFNQNPAMLFRQQILFNLNKNGMLQHSLGWECSSSFYCGPFSLKIPSLRALYCLLGLQ